ncbi:MAG: arginase family protein [Schleiferiaceae bacterium]|nr:arginase family protein [Schleiferiaceae bacterium]
MNPFDSYQTRSGERRLGDLLKQRAAGEGQYIFVGVAEDIGVRANLGRAGAASSPAAILEALAKLPLNPWSESLDLGWIWVDVADLQVASQAHSGPEGLPALRELVAQVDARVEAAVQPLFAAGKIPILLGGGHNNAYPLLKAAAVRQPMNALNLDPHPDCRALEGRHSGNGFSYAHAAGYLNRYCVLGLSEHGCNEASWEMIQSTPGWTALSYESWAIRGEMDFTTARNLALQHVQASKFGMEVCADGIVGCPSSAQTELGWTWEQVAESVYLAGQSGQAAYLHLAEIALGLCPEERRAAVAKAAAWTAMQFIRGCESPME